MSAAELTALLALAMLEGSLVALPTAGALAGLTRLRSPAWGIVLPGSILVGTFGPLWHPSLASGLVVLAAVATPLLALVVVLGMAGRRRMLLLASLPALAFGTALAGGLIGQLSSSLLTALGCLALGVALTRLIPRRWMLLGAVLMCSLDVLLLMVGVGQPAAALVADATAHFHGPTLDRATIGPVTVDYPDLVLAGVVGGFVAGQPFQRRAAVILTSLAAASGMLLPYIHIVPETVPIALTFVFIGNWERALRRPRRQRDVAPRSPRAVRVDPQAWQQLGLPARL